jgi:hypothetical protein
MEVISHKNSKNNGNTSPPIILLEKTIYITQNNTNWRNHPIIQEIVNHTHNILPAPPTHPLP